MNAAELEQHLHRRIPITRDMGLTVSHLDDRSIRLCAPLAPNLNDKDTAFGGSLAAMLTLSGWGLLQSRLERMGLPAEVVIQKSEFLYNNPVRGDFSVYCDAPAEPVWERFLDSLRRRGRGRVVISSWIGGERNAAVTMEGRYVAMLNR